MNEPTTSTQQDAIDVRQLARAIRFALVAIVLGLSYFSLRGSLAIEDFRRVFTDMLGSRPLPAPTTTVLALRPVFVAVSVLVPITAIATLFLRGLVNSFYIIGALALITIAQFIILYQSLSTPLAQIISAMGGTNPP